MHKMPLIIIDMLDDFFQQHAWHGVGRKAGFEWLTPSAPMRAGLRPRA
jgi:hypothetical protein